ncbi:MAG TPA: IPTL-CTERM sorting domain-containing protein [Thermoanaerobaculia bacterium]|jgi:hypothetical protein
MWDIGKRLAVAGALVLSGAALAQADAFEASFRPGPVRGPGAVPPLPPPGPLSVQLVIDDNVPEGSVGVTQGAGARQFMWFNRFASPGAFDLEQIWVLFPADPVLAPGLSVELVVYHDPDGNPANGANHLASIPTTILTADGTTFSIYNLAPAVAVPAGGDVLIGVVNRFVVSGVTPPNFPASIDSTASQTRSWVATWSGDPPAPPTLPSDGTMAIIDTFPGLEGNWMVRGLGTLVVDPGEPALDIPALGPLGWIALTSLLAAFGWRRLRREVRR